MRFLTWFSNLENDFKFLVNIEGESAEIKMMLGNKHLRNLLTDLNQHGQDIDKKIENYMQEPLFQELSDVCLKLVQNKSELEILK